VSPTAILTVAGEKKLLNTETPEVAAMAPVGARANNITMVIRGNKKEIKTTPDFRPIASPTFPMTLPPMLNLKSFC
jgi:hypothetical protein